MPKNNTGRRHFIKAASMGLGSLSLTSLTPSATDPAQKKLRIVCVGAHPGDPEFGCGGTMARYAAAGHAVTFLYLTRGEAYDAGKSYAEAAALRTREAEVSCGILHAKPLFAGQIDANTVLNKEENERIAKLIMTEQPDLVFSQWPLDTHPDHQVTGLLTLTAWIRSGRKFRLYFYEVNTGSETMEFVPTDYVDISDVRDQKKQAMFAHKSQDPEEVYNNWFRTMEEFRGLEAGVKAAEAFLHFSAGAPTKMMP